MMCCRVYLLASGPGPWVRMSIAQDLRALAHAFWLCLSVVSGCGPDAKLSLARGLSPFPAPMLPTLRTPRVCALGCPSTSRGHARVGFEAQGWTEANSMWERNCASQRGVDVILRLAHCCVCAQKITFTQATHVHVCAFDMRVCMLARACGSFVPVIARPKCLSTTAGVS